MDKYIKEKIKEIKKSKTDEELTKIVKEIYRDGSDAGYDDGYEYAYYEMETLEKAREQIYNLK